MMKKRKIILRDIEVNLCIVLMIVMLIVATLGVFFRYVLNNSLVWSDEICRYMFMWLVFLSASYAVAMRKQLTIELLTTYFLKDRIGTLKIIKIMDNIICIVFSLFLIIVGYKLVINTIEISPVLQIPMKVVYSCLPIGCLLIVVRIVETLLQKEENEETAEYR